MLDLLKIGVQRLIKSGPKETLRRLFLRMGLYNKSIQSLPSEERTKYYEEFINFLFDFRKDKSQFVEYTEHRITFLEEDVRPIAFYLPQFHTTPENDEWWGRGFTEWTNVTKAIPQFTGHRQPRLPIDVGFYDLSNISVFERQVALAKNYGIYGFCFHYYWFAGKRLLEKPIEMFLCNKSPELDFPFCICWANEDWTKVWVGNDRDVLIKQEYSDENDISCIKDICRFVRDERYIKINGRPLVVIYRSAVMPDAKRTVGLWREYCRSSGIGEVKIVTTDIFSKEEANALGFDCGLEFSKPLEDAILFSERSYGISKSFRGHVINADKYISEKHYLNASDSLTYKALYPSFDNSPRRITNSEIFQLTPKQYETWLRDICNHAKTNRESGDRHVFIHSWNEWAEGAHLEPDNNLGYAYLEKTAQVVKDVNEL